MERKILTIETQGQGFYNITPFINRALNERPPYLGLVHLFLQHTSASLAIQENADPTARADMEAFLNRLAPENQAWHQHTLEGPDDTTSHLKSLITQPSLLVPVEKGALSIGRWQGIFLLEHRRAEHLRNLTITFMES